MLLAGAAAAALLVGGGGEKAAVEAGAGAGADGLWATVERAVDEESDAEYQVRALAP